MATAARAALDVEVEGLEVSVFTVPTEEPESDGTLQWDSVTMIVVEARGGGDAGLGYTYGDEAVAAFITSKLGDVVKGADALSPPAAWAAMQEAIRNAGHPGVGAMAVSAVDIAGSVWPTPSRATTGGCPSTAAGASPHTRTSAWPSSSRAGRRWGSRGSR
jgi:hypothetical protein